MPEIVADPQLVAYCGLYCGACRRYLHEACPGCRENAKATWCKVKQCCEAREYETCANCLQYRDPQQCGKYNNLIARLFGLLFNSNRAACIARIQEQGTTAYAEEMTAAKRQSLPRRG